MRTKHCLKTNREPFRAIATGKKKSEFRFNDRNFQFGDILELYEMSDGYPTGCVINCTVSHIQTGYGIPKDYVMLSFGYVGSVAQVSKRDCRVRLGLGEETPDYSKEPKYSEMLLEDVV